jgi:succinate-semialdehyde dehydrogenase/glutarate-semialdehyde dehydrogenase
VRQLSFTGSLAVGRMLAQRCAVSGKKASLELGGHAPFVVFADADLELAAEKLTFSKLQNAGQTCIAANRVLVERPALDALGGLLVERMRSARVGDGLEPGVTVGPLIDARAVAKAAAHVDDALSRGARALCGGGAVDGLDAERFYAPTILADVPLDARIATEETFGPIAPLIPFDDEAGAIALANASEYGLAAYLFTRDLGRAHRVGEALEYGMVAVNDGALGWVQAPFGGVKGSGDAREGGRLGLEDYLDVQYLSVNF